MTITCVSRCVAIAFISLGAATWAAPDPGPNAPLPTPAPANPVTPVWRLDAASEFEDSSGIIFLESVKFRGTMNMTRQPQTTPSAANQYYQISEINWLITPNIGEEFYVSGWGEYRTVPTVGMLTVIGHRMTVNVKWGSDTALRRFDSGVIAMSNSQAGRTVDIVMHEVFPTDAGWPNNPTINPERPSLRIKGAALPRSEVRPYTTTPGQSEFLNGCYAPCACPLTWQNMEGRFGLVALPGGAGHLQPSEWALVNMGFNVRTNSPTPIPTPTPTPTPTPASSERRFGGAGILQQFPQMGATIAPRQRMRADISDSLPTFMAQPQRFDSGLVTRTVAMPQIDISVADNDFNCFNRVLHIVARPVLMRTIGIPAPEPIGMPYPGPKPVEDR